MICIFVEDYLGMRVEFSVIPSDPVHSLKRMIEEIDGKLIGECLLAFLYVTTVQLIIWTAYSGAKA
jgi:hypothetical protein